LKGSIFIISSLDSPGAGFYEKAKELESAIQARGIKEKANYQGKQKGDDFSDYIIAEMKRGFHIGRLMKMLWIDTI